MVFSHAADPAYMAVLDIATYDKDMADWDYERLTTKIASQMEQERIFAWGCPEGDLQIRITANLPSGSSFHPIESVSGFLATSGQLCFTSYDNLTMCAQFEKYHFPEHKDHPFTVDPGRYQITVYRMFHWQHGEDSYESIEEGDHFIIVLRPAPSSAPSLRFDSVPWAWRPEKSDQP
jgi:hypothetical protein